MSVQIEELMKHGPLKPEETRGLSEEQANLDKDIEDKYKPKKTPMPAKVGNFFNEDKSNHRTGWTFDIDTVNIRLEQIHEIKEKLKLDNVDKKKTIQLKDLLESIDMLRAIVYLCYPGYSGLPEWEPCMCLLESKEDILNKEDNIGEYFKYSSVTLWCAGREYERHKFLSDYVGKNEKTKIVAKFSVKGQGAPVREAPVDSETQKRMMAMYYKKQEEIKKLEENNEDDYLNSKWADPKNLKNSMHGGGKDISWNYK